MKFKSILCSTLICVAGFSFSASVTAQEFEARKITDKVFTVKSTDSDEEQVVIVSEKGLVVLNSFSCEPTARKLKAGIVETLKRDDFLYLINLVDRLDRCGGNAAYEGVPIIGHRGFWDNYRGNDSAVDAEVNRMIEMWRWKENVARERMPDYEPGSEQALSEQQWINTCKKRADELESGFSLVLPTETYEDRKTLDLGDITLNLIWFGKAKGSAITVIVIPQLKLAILPDDLLSPLHLAPYPNAQFKKLDVTRWINVLEEILEGENPVENVLLCDFINAVWSRDRTWIHLDYIRKLWNGVRKADAEGKSLDEIHTQLSLDNDFAFVKEMPVYLERGDDWVRPQHQTHTRLFYLQDKNPASAIIMNMGVDSLTEALAHIRALRDEGGDIYIEETGINGVGYYLLRMEKFTEAIAVFELNVEVFPESFNVYDSYAEALMKNGDTEGAIANYKKSLALNPENDNARQMLQTLENP